MGDPVPKGGIPAAVLEEDRRIAAEQVGGARVEYTVGHRCDPDGHVWGFAAWEPHVDGTGFLVFGPRPVLLCPCGRLKYGTIEPPVTVHAEQAFAPILEGAET